MSTIYFFFKQKTAYEMRISVWSSDVCSSDLRHHAPQAGADLLDRMLGLAPAGGLEARLPGLVFEDPVTGEAARLDVLADRKSVVSGKRVSVRGAYGGRRIIKYKKQ